MKDLHVLISIASSGSFRGAAERLFTTQPTITRSVARLENSLGIQIFDRGPRGAQVTGEGETVLERAKRILELVTEMRIDAASPGTQLLLFGTAATAAGSYLAPFLAQWIRSHPHVQLRMLENGAARLRHHLERNECDVAIITTPFPPEFNTAPLTDVGVRAYFPVGHPLARSSSEISLNELSSLPLLVYDLPFLSTQLLIEAFDRSGIRPHIVYQSGVGRTLATLAEAGLGVAVLGDSVDLRGMNLMSRPVTADGRSQLGFELHVAWRRIGTPQWIQEFGMELSEFSSLDRSPLWTRATEVAKDPNPSTGAGQGDPAQD